MFDEETLRKEIAEHWGEHGAHVEVYDMLIRKVRNTEALTGAPLFYPQAREWMWNYCIYLGSFVCEDGTKLDLGIWMNDGERVPSAAIVYGNEPGEYISGELHMMGTDESWSSYEYYEETRKRARALGLME